MKFKKRKSESRLSRANRSFRRTLFESLESRHLLAADPTLLRDIAIGSESSTLIAWTETAMIGGVEYFVAEENGSVGFWKTDLTPEGTSRLQTLGTGDLDRHVVQLGGKHVVHESSPNSGSTTFYSYDGTDVVTTVYPFATRFLGAINGQLLIQDEQYQFLRSDGVATTSFVTAQGPATTAYESYEQLHVRVQEPGTENYFLWRFDGASFGGNYGWGNQENPLRRYFGSSESVSVYVAEPWGGIYEQRPLDIFYGSKLLAQESVQPDQIVGIGEMVYSATYDANSNSTRVARFVRNYLDPTLSLPPQPTTTLQVFQGKASIEDLSGRLLASVSNGADSGKWLERTDGTGFDRDSQLSKLVGPDQSIQRVNYNLFGWSTFADVGTELATYSPDPWIEIRGRVVPENGPNIVLDFPHLQWSLGNATFSLVSGDGSEDNSDFRIDSDGLLITNVGFDFETDPIKNLRIRAEGNFGPNGDFTQLESSFAIFVSDVPEVVRIDRDSVPEDAGLGTLIGRLNATGLAAGDAATYSVVAVDGVQGSNDFTIAGDELRLNRSLDFETTDFHWVQVMATSNFGNQFIQDLFVRVQNVNENASSQITLSNDAIAENQAPGSSIGTLGVRSQSGPFTFSLVDGPGSNDNSQFQIVNGELVLNGSANYEAQKIYSLRVRAENGSTTIEDVIAVDVLPVDEYAPEGISFLVPNQPFDFGFFTIEENTPIGTVAMELEVVDFDGGETYTFTGTGGMMNYFTIVGNRLVVTSPINYETHPFDYLLSITATSASGVSITRQQSIEPGSFGRVPIIDINDAPVLANISDQEVTEELDQILQLGLPLATDEDAQSQNMIVEYGILVNGDVAPSWMSLDASLGTLSVSAPAGFDGDYSIEIFVRDGAGGEDRESFTLTVLPSNLQQILGTNGNDTIVARPINNAGTIWRVTVNGAIAYQGNGTGVQLDGAGGVDTVTVFGTASGNQFDIIPNRVKIDTFRVLTSNIEDRIIQGQAGADSFLINGSTLATARAVASPGTTIYGGSGADTLQSLSLTNFWTVSGGGSGFLNDVAFNGIENLVGGGFDDVFTIERNGSLTGRVDGGGGFDTIRYGERTGRIVTHVSNLTTFEGTTSLTGGFQSIEWIDAPARANNQLSYETNSLFEGTVYWFLDPGTSSLGQDPNQSQTQPFLFNGFRVLVGSEFQDDYIVKPGLSDLQLLGGDGFNFVEFNGFPSMTLNMQSRTGPGVVAMEGMYTYYAFSDDATVIGDNVDKTWFWSDMNAGWNDAFQTQFSGFHHFIGGSGKDHFEFAGTETAVTLDGGAGRDSIGYSLYTSSGVTVDLGAGTASYVLSIRGFEDVYGSPFDDVIYGNSSSNYLFGFNGNDFLYGLGGNDAIFGGADQDVLVGNGGADWLVGGSGPDTLLGGTGDDILVGGLGIGFESEQNSQRDFVQTARIDAVMTEWGSNRSYSQRIQRLQSGVGSGNVRLANTTLADDLTIDTLQGEEGDDWFWAGLIDSLPDRRNAERLSRHG